jgi:arylsulfatase A-like enzyme
MKKIIVSILTSCLLVACNGVSEPEVIADITDKAPVVNKVDKKANVLFILIDDLGYSDISAYNADSFYETPNIDQLALTGTKFNNGYSANPVCSPSRYALLTGRHPSRSNTTDFFRHGNRTPRSGNFIGAAIQNFLPLEEQTLSPMWRGSSDHCEY